MATYTQGLPEHYIREYLDPSDTLNDSPTTEDEAMPLWASLEHTFREEGGTGMSEEEFLDGVRAIQERHGWPQW